MTKIKSKGREFDINDDTNQVSIGGLIDPRWVVTSTFDDNKEGELLGIYNTGSGEFVDKNGNIKFTVNEEDI